ncbi:MAG: CDP-diacylglycerol--serine O-phosphatidyltransferase [Saprospiraceae bacterium]|nr:CDP-diacylglycerol--serine O-phosphatidyltransferase [Saprospiraceae bacterium]
MLLNLPNILTLTNLLFGCSALLFLFLGEYRLVMLCLVAAAIADVFDGLAARMLKINSDLGKELDSIADMVSFGLVPGAIGYFLLLMAGDPEGTLPPALSWDWKAFPGFLITAFAGLRLAKFNLDQRQSDSFLGLPTPSACFFIVGLLMIVVDDFQGLSSVLLNPWLLYFIFALVCWLMVSELPLFSLKLKNFGWKGNEWSLSFFVFSIICLLIWKEHSLAPLVALYVLTGLIRYLFFSPKKTT